MQYIADFLFTPINVFVLCISGYEWLGEQLRKYQGMTSVNILLEKYTKSANSPVLLAGEKSDFDHSEFYSCITLYGNTFN